MIVTELKLCTYKPFPSIATIILLPLGLVQENCYLAVNKRYWTVYFKPFKYFNMQTNLIACKQKTVLLELFLDLKNALFADVGKIFYFTKF